MSRRSRESRSCHRQTSLNPVAMGCGVVLFPLVLFGIGVIAITLYETFPPAHVRERREARSKAESRFVTLGGKLIPRDSDEIEGTIHLGGTQATDADLVGLQYFLDTDDLDLRGTQITDEGMRHVAALKSMRHLDLSHTKITDNGLRLIKHFDGVRELNLSHTRITDAGLPSLLVMKRMKRLDLSHTAVSDAGLRHLADMPRLTWLSLENTNVRGPGLANLSRCHQISHVNLSHTPIDDTAVPHLVNACKGIGERLRSLQLEKSGITQIGMNQLIKQCPRVSLQPQRVLTLPQKAEALEAYDLTKWAGIREYSAFDGERQSGESAAAAIDGDQNTVWKSKWLDKTDRREWKRRTGLLLEWDTTVAVQRIRLHQSHDRLVRFRMEFPSEKSERWVVIVDFDGRTHRSVVNGSSNHARVLVNGVPLNELRNHTFGSDPHGETNQTFTFNFHAPRRLSGIRFTIHEASADPIEIPELRVYGTAPESGEGAKR